MRKSLTMKDGMAKGPFTMENTSIGTLGRASKR